MPTLHHRLFRWSKETPDSIAQRYKESGAWHDITAKEYFNRIYYLALFLESRGVTPDQVGAILSYNCPEWIHADMAMTLLGGKSVGLYPNSTSKDLLYILNHTGASVLSLQNKDYFTKIVGADGGTPLPPTVKLILSFDGDVSYSPLAVSYAEALKEGKRLASEKGAKTAQQYLDAIDPKAGAFLIYTSGTTGSPKGAILSHDNFAFTIDIVVKHWELPFGGSVFSFLPLSHVAEKLQNQAAGITQRYAVSFCTKFDNVSIELPEVKPTLLLCVPRVWEKVMEGVLHKIHRSPVVRQKLANWALGVGARMAEAKYAGRLPALADLAQYPVAEKLVLSKIREAIGVSNCERMASGAAALPAHVSKWFRSLGLEILEDFGQTETTGVICMTQIDVDSLGAVGVPVPGIEMKIAEDGEILTRGRHVFIGYFKDEAATRATKEADGWLHTGDLGEIDSRGLVRIRGRKKEVLKTSGGKMIAPLPIEERLKAAPIISQVCMVGEGRKYLSALITLSENKLTDLREKGTDLTGQVITDSEVLAEVKVHVAELNSTLASFEQIKKVTVLTKEFSIESGEMTPTLKMKRNVIESRYQDLIDAMYGAGGEG